ncbi:hypothetical protein GN156_33945, partial [bacterium LRH843]|nr:hypothetical protein [bacterium LRH843]
CNELPNWAKQKLPAIDLQQPGLNTKTLQRLICEKMTQKELDDALFAEAKAGRDTWLAQLHAQGGDATIKHPNELGGKETPIHIA